MSKRLVHTPEGVRDIYGAEFQLKTACEQEIHKVLHTYGYQDIQTPTFEFFDVFGKEIGTTPSKELYKFFDKEGNTLVLRPDFTPSIARCAAKYYIDTDVPVRFCYKGNAFSNTSNLQGKLKEVTEMGAELIGDNSINADAEMIAMCIKALLDTGLVNFQVSIGEVEYIKGLCAQAGLDDETEMELRDLISMKNFFGAQDLLERSSVIENCREALLHVSDLFGQAEILNEAKKYAYNSVSMDAITRLEQLYEVLCAYGVEKYVSFDLGMVSKYNYYTGIIFKVYTYGVGDAIVKGGRYDRLLEKFGKQAPAIGFMVVIDALTTALKAAGITPAPGKQNLALLYREQEWKDAIAKANELRADGANVSMIPYGTDNKEEILTFIQESGQMPYILEES